MFQYKGLIFGGPPLSVDDGYLTLLDFPIPVILNGGRVFVDRAPLYVPVNNFGIPADFSSQQEFESWFSEHGRESLSPHLLEFAVEYAQSDTAKLRAKVGLSQIFGF